MNDELITMNEVFNDGNKIYFYQDQNTGMWKTYGYSAFLLSQVASNDHIASFSEYMQMPCTCITDTTFKSIVKENMKTISLKENYYELLTELSIGTESYQKWVVSLK